MSKVLLVVSELLYHYEIHVYKACNVAIFHSVPRRNCPSPHNPFSLPARASSPGNPFAPPIASSTAPPDDVLPFSDVCEPMQPIKIDVMFPELATNDRPIATSNTTNDVAATYGESSDFPERYLSKTQEDVPTNHVADGPSS